MADTVDDLLKLFYGYVELLAGRTIDFLEKKNLVLHEEKVTNPVLSLLSLVVNGQNKASECCSTYLDTGKMLSISRNLPWGNNKATTENVLKLINDKKNAELKKTLLEWNEPFIRRFARQGGMTHWETETLDKLVDQAIAAIGSASKADYAKYEGLNVVACFGIASSILIAQKFPALTAEADITTKKISVVNPREILKELKLQDNPVFQKTFQKYPNTPYVDMKPQSVHCETKQIRRLQPVNWNNFGVGKLCCLMCKLALPGVSGTHGILFPWMWPLDDKLKPKKEELETIINTLNGYVKNVATWTNTSGGYPRGNAIPFLYDLLKVRLPTPAN